jgi:hypothetical protein
VGVTQTEKHLKTLLPSFLPSFLHFFSFLFFFHVSVFQIKGPPTTGPQQNNWLPYNPPKEKKEKEKGPQKEKDKTCSTYSFSQNFLSKFSIPARYGWVPNVENLQ